MTFSSEISIEMWQMFLKKGLKPSKERFVLFNGHMNTCRHWFLSPKAESDVLKLLLLSGCYNVEAKHAAELRHHTVQSLSLVCLNCWPLTSDHCLRLDRIQWRVFCQAPRISLTPGSETMFTAWCRCGPSVWPTGRTPTGTRTRPRPTSWSRSVRGCFRRLLPVKDLMFLWSDALKMFNL